MASSSLIRNAALQDLYVCARCSFRATRLSRQPQRRWIGMKYLAKQANAENAWQAKAQEINDGTKQSMLSILEERGLVHQIAGDRDTLDKLMTSKRIGAYVGIDPTASSLHVGHLLPLMSLFWLYCNGYHAVSLLGGATCKIGDPSDRLVSREKQLSSIRTANMTNMHYQLKKLWVNVEAYGRKYGYKWEWAWHRELVNNNTWMNKLPIMDVLQLLGPGMRMGSMLARDTVKNKLEKGDGMSYAEFTYPLLQAWDWWHMYNTKGIQMQIGGSDQYGNITAGIDAVKYISAHHPDPDVRAGKDVPSATPYGFTVPLLTTSSGVKFGKSAGNAIWLDKDQTSSFDLYGFFVRQSDEDVSRYLKLFTFMPIPEIETLMEEHMKAPSQRLAQHKLAREFLELVHGPEEAKAAEVQHRIMYQKYVPRVEHKLVREGPQTAEQLRRSRPPPVTLNNAPAANIKLPRSLIENRSIGRIIYAAGLAASASEGHRFAAAGSVYIGARPGRREAMNDAAVAFTPITVWTVEETKQFLIDGNLLILRKGKHNVRIVEIVEDDVWAELGTKYPGEVKEVAADKRA